MARPRDQKAHRAHLRETLRTLDADAYARGLRHWCNDHRHPLRSCWARGYAVGYVGGGKSECPYVRYSDHGGTWGRQAYGAWRDGRAEGLRDGGHENAETESGE